MDTLTRWLLWLIPHFRTIYYLEGTHRKTGEHVTIHVPDLRELPEKYADCVHRVSVFCVFGRAIVLSHS